MRHDGQFIGGIGVHGNSAERDEELARVGVEAMGLNGGSPERRSRAEARERSSTVASPTSTPTTKRKSTNLPGLSPSGANPEGIAPDLVQVGNLFFTSAIRGVDLSTGRLGETPEEQFKLAWRNLRALVEHAGLSLDDVGFVSNFLDTQDYRTFINPGWLELWPSDDSRPARKTTAYPLPAGEAVELQAFGVVG